MVSRRLAVLAIVATAGLSGCSAWMLDDPKVESSGLKEVVTGPARTSAETARDPYRHPYDALSFWGVKPGDTIVEIWPGGGYWTEMLAPYAKATGGTYIAALTSRTRGLPER